MKPLIWFTLAMLAVTALPARSQDVRRGAALYRLHCATCHGIEATGGGPMGAVLLIRPRDLTTLQNDNGGVFPTARVVRRIDGRDPLVSHGSAMPVFGHFFDGRDVAIKTPDGQPMMTSQPIVDLLDYLRSIQSI